MLVAFFAGVFFGVPVGVLIAGLLAAAGDNTGLTTWADEALPVVTVSPSSGWPESDLIYRGTVYRYQGGLRWKRDAEAVGD